MTICNACSAEIIGRDRFCRNCGAPVAVSVAELEETSRFNPAGPPSTTAQTDPTNRFYSPPAGHVVAQSLTPLAQTASLVNKLLKRKAVWLLPLVLLAIFAGAGIGFFWGAKRDRQTARAEARAAGRADASRRAYDEAVQNALGFKQGRFLETEFPGVRGIFVSSLMSDDSPAALAGIQAGDLLTELNNQAARNDGELSQVLEALKTGEEVPVKVYRDGETVSSRLKLGDPTFPPFQPKTAPRDQGFLGIKDSVRRCCVPGTKKWGVEINELHDNSPADLFGLRPGDVITEFDGHQVKTPNEFNRRIRASKPRGKVLITLYRGNTEQKLEVIIGRRW